MKKYRSYALMTKLGHMIRHFMGEFWRVISQQIIGLRLRLLRIFISMDRLIYCVMRFIVALDSLISRQINQEK